MRKTIKNRAEKLLNCSAIFWFIVAVLGQWIFAYYVFSFYGKSGITGDFEKWNEVMTGGHRVGDNVGNIAVALHVFFVVIVMLGGPLQIIPKIRQWAPKFHHWNGRIYILASYILALSGIFMLWTRGSVGDIWQHLGTSSNGIFIVIAATLAIKFALARNIKKHRKWALRLYVSMAGVWFFRIGIMLSFLLNGGPFYFDYETFTGPFLIFLAFGQYLIPLAVLEFYFISKENSNNAGKLTMALTLIIITIFMAIGIFAATMGMWLPML